MYKLTLALSLMVLVSFSGSWAAEPSISVTPGNYKITTTTRSNVNPNPQVVTEDNCLKNTSYNINRFLPDDDNCKASNVKKSGNKISFDIKCTGDQEFPTMSGTAEVSASSKKLSSHFKMAGVFQGQDVSVDSTSEGTLTGDCK